jgi:hypothetical protein
VNLPLEKIDRGEAADTRDVASGKVINWTRTPYQANTAASLPPVYRGDFSSKTATEDEEMPTEGELTDAKIAASEARGETNIARLEGKIDTLTATIVGKLDAVSEKMSADHEYNRTTRWVMVGLAVAICALIVGMATYGDALFGRGMNVRDLVNAVVKEQQDAAKKLELPKPSK